jgi:hypothetical protein
VSKKCTTFNKVVAFDKSEFAFSKKLIRSKDMINPPGSIYSFGSEVAKKAFENQKEVVLPQIGNPSQGQETHEDAERERYAEAD